MIPVCSLADLEPERGAAALVDGRQIALFRVVGDDGRDVVHALDNRDPACGANVLARGLLGTDDRGWYVASPMFKHRFALADGRCPSDPDLVVATHRAEVRDGVVLVAVGGPREPT